MNTAAVNPDPHREKELRSEFGAITRFIVAPYFEAVRFTPETESELRTLHERGFVVHVMRTTAWINFLYLAWALLLRGLPPIRAVVNLRPWFAKPWRKTAQRGDFDVRFTYARRQSGSGLIFLRKSAFGRAEGRNIREDPFPALVAMARKGERTVYLVPELFVWEKTPKHLKPRLIDYVFGSPEAPGFLHSLLAFWRNYRRAQFRIGEPIDLRKVILENPSVSDELIARKVRGVLNIHLARETRAVFGPPVKPAERVIDETLRDRALRRSLEEISQKTGTPITDLLDKARENLESIAARPQPTMVAMLAPLMRWIFNRIYDGIEIDEPGLDNALKSGARAPVVLCPSHKSHVDYLVMSWILWQRGYNVPVVAAGANLSFFPLGWIFRRGGAFFLRRSFKDDPIYSAAFQAYIKRLVHDGTMQEFFPEGGRSRTGKLMRAKLGMLTWEVDAIREGARDDLVFVPVSIDYEKVVESSSYSHELSGGEKTREDFRGLLSARKVLRSNYGRIHLSFDQPISLSRFAKNRRQDLNDLDGEPKRRLVRALGHQIMYGIGRVSTITPQALVSAALLAHRRRGIGAVEVSDRIRFLRDLAERERARLSSTLTNAPSDPTVLGPIQDAMRAFLSDRLVRMEEVKGEKNYLPVDERRLELSYYKNTLMNLFAPPTLVANALLLGDTPAPLQSKHEAALFLSRLFKFEFIYRVDATFEVIFNETIERLAQFGLVAKQDQWVGLAPEAYVRPKLELLADLLRDYLESYYLACLTLAELQSSGPIERKTFLRNALETGRAEFLAGRIGATESLSRSTLENALNFFVDQNFLLEENKLLRPNPNAPSPDSLLARIRAHLSR